MKLALRTGVIGSDLRCPRRCSPSGETLRRNFAEEKLAVAAARGSKITSLEGAYNVVAHLTLP